MKKYFQFEELGTNYRREIIGGVTTFLAMAYILAVNPEMLSSTGMDKGAVFVATAVAAIIGSLIMGILAKYPIALAPGMGLNAFFAFTVVAAYGIPWQTGLTGVFFSGIIFIILSLTGIRETIINAIPVQLKYAVSAGIGLFITFVGLKGAGIIVADEATLITLGNFTQGSTLLAVAGIVIAVILMVRKVPGAIFITIILSTIIGMLTGVIEVPKAIVSSIPSLAPTFGVALDPILNDFSSLLNLKFLIVVLTFLFVDFFDTAGTLMAVADKAGLVKNNKLPRAGRALMSDALGTTIGSVLGTSTTTAYVESTAGVAAGARSGFAAVVTAILFGISLFFFPLLDVITSAVTAPALVIVGILMVSSLKLIEWDKFEIAVPAFLTMIMMPLGYSIASGIAVGFIFYPITMLLAGRRKEVHWIMYLLFFVFIAYFIWVR
ncbi:guanine permease [Kurthia zopfii]|uniref:AGZA family xanthine/uracil permease-like MFS transporter n=1 Tax=Kurthia zopfii TaxID=1650 RepID=A0A8B4QDW8_9BACL|nr:NCS2 family permease [Kurthia zopfii]PWI22680.1 guanine permease [Kurthia zopfii]TDR39479.1 AGZA family xanthine/uracil permease-like MFS transporter [Kurthia zopfii]GEK30548.1 guanine permease [Kurthia zopfii]STX10788.1 Guanine/hypoxanthine permease pbuG [Kurthia zopfii]